MLGGYFSRSNFFGNSVDVEVKRALSYEFYTTMFGSNEMTWMGWRILGDWSFEYSMVNEEEKEERTCVSRKK
jgi:hypothetical protein